MGGAGKPMVVACKATGVSWFSVKATMPFSICIRTDPLQVPMEKTDGWEPTD